MAKVTGRGSLQGNSGDLTAAVSRHRVPETKSIWGAGPRSRPVRTQLNHAQTDMTAW
jgi:hypothetical protein